MTISKINGVAWAAIAKVGGVAVASLSKVNGQAVPAGVAASIAFLQTASSAIDANIYSFASQSLGDADATRVIIAVVMGRAAGARTLTVTIGGVNATEIVKNTSDSGWNTMDIFAASVPTGTTGNVVVTWSGTMVRCGVAMYRALNCSASAEDTATSLANPLSDNLSVTAGSIQVAGAFSEGASRTAAWSGATPLTEDYDAVIEANAMTAASRNSAAAATVNAVCTWTTSTNPILVGASFAKA